jgi:heptosyltransferase I
MRVLLIKMSSLGDVVHTLAAVTDAARAVPKLVLDWVVEEAYQEIPKWHPAVHKTILSPLRRWKKSPVRTLRTGEWARFREELRSEKYDLVLDAQGLLKSAFVGLQARGPLTGRSAGSAREPAAALLYKRRIRVDLELTEVEQLRQLFALGLRYTPPKTKADFGITPEQFRPVRKDGYVLLLHGAAWESKLWPEENWIEVASKVRNAGLQVLLPWGNEKERRRAEKIAKESDAEVLAPLEVGGLAALVAHSEFVVGLDTGLTHIAVALGVRTATLYGPSVPVYERVARGELINLSSTNSRVVDTSRPNTVKLETVFEAISPWLKESKVPA